tara:strand:+ start:113 stop:220 length:108 start_codon:yes stop_codon:yes gene_type:complete
MKYKLNVKKLIKKKLKGGKLKEVIAPIKNKNIDSI